MLASKTTPRCCRQEVVDSIIDGEACDLAEMGSKTEPENTSSKSLLSRGNVLASIETHLAHSISSLILQEAEKGRVVKDQAG
jgi:hypothetical protein